MVLKNKNLIYYLLIISVAIKLLILITLGAKPFLDGLWYMKTAEAIWNNNFLYPNSELRDAPLTPYFFAFLSLEAYFWYKWICNRKYSLF